MIALFYIITSLAFDPYVQNMHGGDTLCEILGFGIPVMGLMSVFFIFYISSFVKKRRKKELGLYSVLGMEKKHIIAVISRENFIVAVSSIASGLVMGLIFHKVSQLILLKMTQSKADLDLMIPVVPMATTAVLFAFIFVLVSIAASAEVRLRSTLGYLKSGTSGEKKPKANILLGILGLIVLGGGYVLACSVTKAVSAFTYFFPAVILVIIGTYMLFVSGSVMLLNMLKNNKDYYYRTKHMVSVSGMLYRMKRNGMGLATICILSTMVLVMISSVTTLLILNNKTMDSMFQRDVCIKISPEGDRVEDALKLDQEIVRANVEDTADRLGYEIKDFTWFHLIEFRAEMNDNVMNFSKDPDEYFLLNIMDLEDYNRITGQDLTLEDGQAGYYCEGQGAADGNVSIAGRVSYEIVELSERPCILTDDMFTYSTGDVYLIVKTRDELVEINDMIADIWEAEFSESWQPYYYDLRYKYINFDIEGDGKEFFVEYSKDHMEELSESDLVYMNTNNSYWEDGTYEYLFSKAMFEDYFYTLYGGLFFLGVILSIACITIAVLVMYFKQILEGYEDAGRFSIMKKVGLSNEDIKGTVYSQIVMVFFMPLLAAGIHTAFAYQMVKRMLTLFAITETREYFSILLICVLVFAVFYGAVFMITSKNYFKLVGNADKGLSSY
jgi:putative ABC transport system permease protein